MYGMGIFVSELHSCIILLAPTARHCSPWLTFPGASQTNFANNISNFISVWKYVPTIIHEMRSFWQDMRAAESCCSFYALCSPSSCCMQIKRDNKLYWANFCFILFIMIICFSIVFHFLMLKLLCNWRNLSLDHSKFIIAMQGLQEDFNEYLMLLWPIATFISLGSTTKFCSIHAFHIHIQTRNIIQLLISTEHRAKREKKNQIKLLYAILNILCSFVCCMKMPIIAMSNKFFIHNSKISFFPH